MHFLLISLSYWYTLKTAERLIVGRPRRICRRKSYTDPWRAAYGSRYIYHFSPRFQLPDTTMTNSCETSTMKIASAKGPLGKWQPFYDGAYSIMMQTFNMPHLAAISFVLIAVFWFRGGLKITPIMPIVAMFGMARVPFVGFGMSMCLHRYFAHGAFKTSRFFQFILAIGGSLALQGVYCGGRESTVVITSIVTSP